MTGKDYFLVGCKVFGVYCLVLFAPAFLKAWPIILRQYQGFNGFGGSPVFPGILQLWPIIYIPLGFYLLIKGNSLCKLAYPNGDISIDLPKGKFALFLKMLGVYLISEYFPDFLRIISEMLFLVSNPQAAYQGLSPKFMIYSILESVWGTFFGIYLITGGQYFVSLAFEPDRPQKV